MGWIFKGNIRAEKHLRKCFNIQSVFKLGRHSWMELFVTNFWSVLLIRDKTTLWFTDHGRKTWDKK